MVEIECLACDNTLELPKFIDTSNYDGQLVCPKCKALLYLKLVKEKVRKYKIVERLRQGEPVEVHVVYENDKRVD